MSVWSRFFFIGTRDKGITVHNFKQVMVLSLHQNISKWIRIKSVYKAPNTYRLSGSWWKEQNYFQCNHFTWKGGI